MIKVVSKPGPIVKDPLSVNKVFLFKIIGILLPFLILLLLELSLRILQYGNSFELFVEFPENKNYLVFNPDASGKYFTNKNLATTGNVEVFKKIKEEGTTRIFVLGESTTAGYPYFHNGSSHRWLQYRLMHTFPEKKFEIINVSLTAVNSYTVLGFAKEIVNYNPDAIMIYVGHNEYYGTLGVASTDKISGNPFIVNLILRLRELRFTQLISNLYLKIKGSPSTDSGGTRMKMMVANDRIPFNSKLYHRGIKQFRSNMDKTLKLFNKNNIPVFFSNLVSNEKDMKPFYSISPESAQSAGYEKNYKSGLEAFKNNDFVTALRFLKDADEIFNANALCNFYLGKIEYNLGNFNKAKEYFIKAKDLDGLRFRAPEEFNLIIHQLCGKYSKVHLVDTKAAFEKWPADNIIGNELILEHVHPDLLGYAIMSDAFYEAMKMEKLFIVDEENSMTIKQLLHDMPVNKVDSLAGIYKISNLKKSWPFNEVLMQDSIMISTEEEKLAWDLAVKKISWQDAINSLYNYYIDTQNLVEARKIMEALVLEYPENLSFYEKTARLSSKLNDYEDAIFYLKRAYNLSPTFENAKNLSLSYLAVDKPSEAMPYIEYAIKVNISGLDLLTLKSCTEEVIQLKSANMNDSANLSVLNKIAKAYLKMDNIAGATLYIKKALMADSKNAEALSMLSQINK